MPFLFSEQLQLVRQKRLEQYFLFFFMLPIFVELSLSLEKISWEHNIHMKNTQAIASVVFIYE